MADQKINALPTKTSPTTGDKVLMSGAAEEYLIDYDQLATAILNKLTSKTFTLDQGAKTLVAALNELNSKFAAGVAYTGSDGTATVEFDTPFSAAPRVFCQIVGTSQNIAATCKINTVSTSGFTIMGTRESNDGSIEPATQGWLIHWFAIEP